MWPGTGLGLSRPRYVVSVVLVSVRLKMPSHASQLLPGPSLVRVWAKSGRAARRIRMASSSNEAYMSAEAERVKIGGVAMVACRWMLSRRRRCDFKKGEGFGPFGQHSSVDHLL